MAVRPAPSPVLTAIVACALATATSPRPVRASEPVSEAPAREDPALDVAMAAFDIGLDAYRDGDYARAVEAWTRAHRLLLHAVDDAEMQLVLGFDLAQAHLRQHARDHDDEHLVHARPLLAEYIRWIERPGHEITADERVDLDHARELLAILEIHAAAATADRRASPYPAGSAPTLSPEIRPSSQPAPPPPPEPMRRLRRDANIWLGTGGASLAVAVVFGATIGVLARNPTGRASAAGVAVTTTGAAMFGGLGVAALTIGFMKREKVLAASPMLSRTGFGANVRLEF